jgi:integrase
VDFDSSEITVNRSWDQYEGPIPTKSKAGRRTVPMISVLRSYLETVEIDSASELLFGRKGGEPFAPKSISERAGRAWDEANKQEREAAERDGREPALLRPITLHECRHTFASLLIDAAVNAKAIQEFMGHATIEETFSRYGHLMPGARDQARELIDAYFRAAVRPVTSTQVPAQVA